MTRLEQMLLAAGAIFSQAEREVILEVFNFYQREQSFPNKESPDYDNWMQAFDNLMRRIQ